LSLSDNSDFSDVRLKLSTKFVAVLLSVRCDDLQKKHHFKNEGFYGTHPRSLDTFLRGLTPEPPWFRTLVKH